MANALSPTAANIISSLGIKGATVSENLAGFVPVLDANGKISVNLIPDDAAKLAVESLSNVFFVDPYTEEDDPSGRTGSIAAPFKTISEAASRSSPVGGRIAIVLAPGVYGDGGVAFRGSPKYVYLIGIGECVIGSEMAISGLGSSPELFLRDISSAYSINVIGSPKITLLGKTYVKSLSASAGAELRISADSRVDSTTISKVFLSGDDRIANTSGVDGATVKDALDRLDSRKIRVAKISGTGSGIDAGSSYEDIGAESFGGFDAYDMRARDSALVGAVKDLYSRLMDVDAHTVTAETITATGTLNAKTLSIDALRLGGHVVEIDTYGYLVVSDGTPHGKDDGAWILRDLGDGSLWLLGVDGGRMFVERFYEDGSGSDDGSGSGSGYPYDVVDEIDLLDGSDTYEVTIVDGRMAIQKT